MIISKDLLTIQIVNVDSCCLSSIGRQISVCDIEEDTQFSCNGCGRLFALSDKIEAHFIPISDI